MSETESESTSDQTTNTNTAINKFMSGNSSSSSNFAQNAWDPQGQALTGFYGDAKNQYDNKLHAEILWHLFKMLQLIHGVTKWPVVHMKAE